MNIIQHPHYGRGVIAKTTIQTRTLVSAVPRNLLIRASVAVKSSVHARTIMNQNHVINTDQAEKMAIGIFVLEQTTLGKKSNFYNYLKSLFENFQMPLKTLKMPSKGSLYILIYPLKGI